MYAKPTRSDKQTVRGHTCGLGLFGTGISASLLIMWVCGCLTGAQQQVCTKPGGELLKFIFNSSSRKTDDAEEAASASASDYECFGH